MGWMTEHGIGILIDFVDAVRHYKMSSDSSAASFASCGWCWYTGKGVPVDLTVATEVFKKALDSNDAHGENNYGCWLERGEGIDANIETEMSLRGAYRG
jgi:TPR repeat protein